MQKGDLLMCRNTHKSYAYEGPFDDKACLVSDNNGQFHLMTLSAISPDWDRIVIFKIKRLLIRLFKYIM